jgi:hypothetical protein
MRNFQHTMIIFAATLSACVIDPTDDDDQGADTEPAATEPGTSNVSSQETEGSQSGGTSNSTNPSTSGDPDDSSGSSSPETSDTAGGDGMICTFECEVAEDCYVMGMDQGLMCEGNRCVGDVTIEPCEDNDDCIAQLSGWAFGTACTTEADCAATMQHCVEVDGAGHCASGPTEFVTCATLMMEEVMVQNIEGDTVTLCGNPNAECRDDGTCFDPCAADTDCPMYAPNCDEATGLCSCSEDAHCETLMSPAASVCLGTGACGCDSDDDCDGVGTDVCITEIGLCGCSGAAACDDVTNPYDGTTVVCAGL